MGMAALCCRTGATNSSRMRSGNTAPRARFRSTCRTWNGVGDDSRYLLASPLLRGRPQPNAAANNVFLRSLPAGHRQCRFVGASSSSSSSSSSSRIHKKRNRGCRGARRRPRRHDHSDPSASEKKKNPPASSAPKQTQTTTKTAPPEPNESSTAERLRLALTPTRFSEPYSSDQAWAALKRLPLFVAGATLVVWTSPVGGIRIHGPSMLPTMASDESDIWLIWKYHVFYHWLGRTPPAPSRGDLVGFSHPDHPYRVSCKRVVGLPGDSVQRYGQYVHLYVPQDPEHFGLVWPSKKEKAYSWIWDHRNWDDFPNQRENTSSDGEALQEWQRIITVPDNHVWLEADCPGLGLDSRHFGPIPIEWLQGRILGRLWPLWSHPDHRRRPHPIPLDDESLMEHNVFRVTKRQERSTLSNDTEGIEEK